MKIYLPFGQKLTARGTVLLHIILKKFDFIALYLASIKKLFQAFFFLQETVRILDL